MGMINIGLSGVLANQIAMNTTAQNTANVNTVGYSRQEVTQSSVVEGGIGGITIGAGVTVDSIRRVADQAAIGHLQSTSADFSYASVFQSSMSGMEELLGSESLNLTFSLGDFFSSIDEATVAPESTAYRQQILSSAQSLADTFNQISDALKEETKNISHLFNGHIDLANNQLARIADLNAAINENKSRGNSTAGLEDQLDLAIQDISENMDVSVIRKPNGDAELSLKSGQPLVVGNIVAKLDRSIVSGDPYSLGVTLEFANETMIAEGIGGAMGAMIDIKTDQIDPKLDQIDEMASLLADEVNLALSTGFDLNGNNPTKEMFNFDPNNPASSLSVTNMTTDELALSSDALAIGNGSVLMDLSALSSQKFSGTTFGLSNIGDAFTQILGDTGMTASQATENLKTAQINYNGAVEARESLSGVNSDEEAANLMMYMQSYQASMKVVSTAQQMFQSILNAF